MALPESWDRETDVIVVGGGTAGLPAAIAAREQGVEVILLEKTRVAVGTPPVTGGYMAFAGTDFQMEHNVEDSPDRFYEDGLNVCKGNPELWRAYADSQLDTYRWLREIGLKPVGLAWVHGHSVPRIHTFSPATILPRKFREIAENKGVEILVNHPAERLCVDCAKGRRVVGVKVRVGDKVQWFKARKAVILTCGGFARNSEMLKEYSDPEIVQLVNKAIPLTYEGNTGDGLKMGVDVGAATVGMGISIRISFPVDVESRVETILPWYGAILVNAEGKRFVDESSYADKMGRESLKQLEKADYYYMFYDENVRRTYWEVYYKKEGARLGLEGLKPIKADTIQELAEKAGIDPEGLKETIDKWNSDLEKFGYDTVFGRRLQSQHTTRKLFKFETPPFYVVKARPCIPHVRGGLKINTKAQVVNVFNEVIPGLYAAGEVTGGLFGGPAYLTGVMLSSSVTFGRMAGKNAASEPEE